MSRNKSSNAADVDSDVLEDNVLITDPVLDNDDICYDILETCVDSAVDVVHLQEQETMKCKQAATDILNGFIYYGKWCYMNKDSGEDDLDCWKQEEPPQRIIPDAWTTNIIPIRKIIQRKENIFDSKSNSKTNSVKSGQSNRSKISKGSLRSKIKRSSMDLEVKKRGPLHNIIDEHSEVDELGKVEIIQLKNEESTNITQQKKKVQKKTKLKKAKIRGVVDSNGNKENNSNSLSINLNEHNRKKYTQNRPSMHIGLKTGRLSMNASNAYKYHPNKPFTYDHTGQKMSVTQMKPEKIPNNIVTPLVSFQDDKVQVVETKKDKKSKNKAGHGASASRKNRKKSNIKSKSKSKIKEQPVFKTNSVPVQPPIESIIKVEGGVSLKTKNTTIKGTEKKKNKIENLSRSEYNQYIQTLKYMTKTHVFDTLKPNNTNMNMNDDRRDEDKEEDTDTQRPSSIANDSNKHKPTMVNTSSMGSLSNLKKGSPRNARTPLNQSQRMKHQSPQSLKYKRGLMSLKTDRLISEYNKNSLLPNINNANTMNVSHPSGESSMNLASTFPNKTSHHNHQMHDKYQRKFMVKSTKSKIEKSKLGKVLFGGK